MEWGWCVVWGGVWCADVMRMYVMRVVRTYFMHMCTWKYISSTTCVFKSIPPIHTTQHTHTHTHTNKQTHKHSLDKGTAARMVRMHVDWHRLMGVRASYVYVTTDFVKYMDDVTLEPYMRYDFLLPVCGVCVYMCCV